MLRDLQQLTFARGQDHRLERLLGFRHGATVVGLEHVVERASLEIDPCQAGEQLAPQVGGIEHHRLTVTDAQALDEDDLVSWQAGQVGCQLTAGLDGLHAQDLRGHLHATRLHGVTDGEDAFDRQLHARPGDEGAASLVSADQAALLQLAERLAQGRAGDAEVLAQLPFGRETVALLPLARGDQLLSLAGDQRVERLDAANGAPPVACILAEVV